jgi:hypothetical protein
VVRAFPQPIVEVAQPNRRQAPTACRRRDALPGPMAAFDQLSNEMKVGDLIAGVEAFAVCVA